jgi:NADPH oxidase
MYTTAVESVRRPMFEGFWFTHHLFIIFYVLMCVHGLAGILEKPVFWMWVIGPLVFYIIERILRRIRGKEKTIIVQAYQHPSRVLEIRMKKAGFNYSPGQFIFLCCSFIADFEWHPFTISSCPDDDYLSVHIRIVGDWTGKLHKLLNPGGVEKGIIQENMHTAPNGKSILVIDGPFGTASEDVWKFETIMLWAAGIGATPFASILKSIKNKIENNSCNLKRVEFYWTNRDVQSFEWFIELLSSLESCPFLEINLYFTGNLNADQVRTYMQAMNAEDTELDAITGLNARTTYGRPDIAAIFAQKAQQFQGQTIGVFFCGPPVMSKELLRCCEAETSVANNIRFIYHKENF